MEENYLDNIEVDGLDETFAQNFDAEEFEQDRVLIADFKIDGSGSMGSYSSTMRDALEHYKESIINSKQADEMLVSKTVFEGEIVLGGYVKPEDFKTDYETGGCTRLYDAIVEGRKRLLDYMEHLKNSGTTARAAVVILSDGMDNASKCSASDARQAIEDMQNKEIVVAFIAFGQEAFDIADMIGIRKKNVLAVTNNESELRRVIDLTSKSMISASKRVSSGATATTDDGFFDV